MGVRVATHNRNYNHTLLNFRKFWGDRHFMALDLANFLKTSKVTALKTIKEGISKKYLTQLGNGKGRYYRFKRK